MSIRANGVKNRTWNPHLWPVFIALISIIVAVGFYWLHLTSPTLGSRLEPGQPAWLGEGLLMTPLVEQPGGLRAGDIVVAIEGQEIRDRASNLFSWPLSRSTWKFGQKIQISVLRANELEELTVTLARYSLRAFLSRQWGALLFAFTSQIVASFVYLRRPEDYAARVLFIWGCSAANIYIWSLGLQLSDLIGPLGFWLHRSGTTGLWTLFWGASLHFALIFPEPPPFLKRRPGYVSLIYLTAFGIAAIYLLIAWLRVRNVYDWVPALFDTEYLVSITFVTGTVLSLLAGNRWWWSPADRKKVRWVLFGGTLAGSFGLIWFLLEIIPGAPKINPNLLGLVILPFPLTIAISILRHNLFDIDIILNRALVYGALTGTLAVVYFAIVILLQRLLPAQTQLTTVLSTMTIAALFSPLRRQIQNDIDRLFYRSKYNAEQTLAAFSATAREEVDLDRLSESLLAIVDETMKPEETSLWIRTTNDR